MQRKTRRSKTARPSQARQEKKKLQIGLVVILLAAVLLGAIFLSSTGTGQASQDFPAFVSVQQAYELYQQEDVFVLDVREPFEWDEVRIPNTTLIPLGQLAGRVNEVPKDAKIVVVCRSGNRSQEARDILLQAGFENVTSMNGGVVSWRSMGYPTIP
ncbi:MAG: rhodanese-like domain-containing protein [Anaerolineales bacterium]